MKGGRIRGIAPPFSLVEASFTELLVFALFISLLFTLAPTIIWRDTPEFANVAFTLSIAHPAGFPTYSLLVKLLTFLPAGTIAFKTNLASALFSALSVIILSAAAKLFIRRVYPFAGRADVQVSSILAALLFALGPIVWHNSISTEVYTLNTLFLAGLIYLILRWLGGFDPRWLYLGVFLYGLSAGNHATVALFLPGFLAVYFFNRTERNSCEWIRAIFFFLLGLSVYLYLPFRSLANPTYDWGDPQSLNNFLYQITDQKDFVADDVFSKSGIASTGHFLFNHLSLIVGQFSPVGFLLIVLGIVVALRHEKGLSLLFLWILLSNHIFFWAWTSGDAFLPSYCVLAVLLGLGTCTMLSLVRRYGQEPNLRLRGIVGIGLGGLIVLQVFFTYSKVNKRDYYLPYDFFRPDFTSIDPHSLLFVDVQWSHLKYFQNVERLREDVSILSLSEINQPSAFHYISLDRHPNLIIPNIQQVPENRTRFITELVKENDQVGQPIFRELTARLRESMPFPVQPHQNFIFKVSTVPDEEPWSNRLAANLKRIQGKLLDVGADMQSLHDHDLNTYLDHYITVLSNHLHSQGLYSEAIHLLRLYLQIFGPESRKSISKENLSVMYNSLGLSELHQGETLNGLSSLELAIQYNPNNADPYLNLALWTLEKMPTKFEGVLHRARANGLNLETVCATLTNYLLESSQSELRQQAQKLCQNHQAMKVK